MGPFVLFHASSGSLQFTAPAPRLSCRLGLLHRDIRLQNFTAGASGGVKVLDLERSMVVADVGSERAKQAELLAVEAFLTA